MVTQVSTIGVRTQEAKKAFSLPDDYYSPEAVAARREENKNKYQPKRRAFVRGINQGISVVYELDSVGGRPYLVGEGDLS